MGNWVCIDFGTCNSAAAIEIDGRPKLVSPNNVPFFPTVACVLSRDKIVVCPLLYIKYQISPKANFIDLIVRKRFSSCIPNLR